MKKKEKGEENADEQCCRVQGPPGSPPGSPQGGVSQIEGLRHRRAARKQREAERQAKQDALSDAVYAVLATRKDLQITAGPELLITFLQATCHLKALVSEDGQVDLSWIYEGRSEPKYSGTVELEEAKDIVLHLVAVRLAAIHVEEDQAVG